MSQEKFIDEVNIENNDGKKTKWLPFEEARAFVHTLELKSFKEYQEWWKLKRPINIPNNADKIYKNKAWISWGDFLGNNNINNINKIFLPYKDAKDFIKKFNFKTFKEYQEWYKNNSPINLPSNPYQIYKNKGWISNGDFLGTNRVASKLKKFLNFNDAKKYIKELNFKNQGEYFKWHTNNNSKIIPYRPNQVYKNEWISWGDFLGTNFVAGVNREYVSYETLRKYANDNSIKSQKDWYNIENRGINIPYHPNRVYKNEWRGWGEFLNKKTNYNTNFLEYQLAKKYMYSIGLNNQKEFQKWATSEKRPDYIPSDPRSVYCDEWKGMSSFLGFEDNIKWTKLRIINFIKSAEQQLNLFDEIELITWLQSNHLYRSLERLGLIQELRSTSENTKERKKAIKNICDVIDNSLDETIELSDTEDILETDTKLIQGKVNNEVESENISEELGECALSPIEELKMFDVNEFTTSMDDERLEFIIQRRLMKMWANIFNEKLESSKRLDPEQLRLETGAYCFTEIKRRFLEEYDEVVALPVPSGYKYQTLQLTSTGKKEYVDTPPKLMQKLICHRLKQNKRYGNWSGTGAGKTLSAILAGRYVNAKNTIIICNNATIDGWVKEIHNAFGNSNVLLGKSEFELDKLEKSLYTIVDDKHDIKLDRRKTNYLILNYETFQQVNSEHLVANLLENNFIDYIVFDEVQNVKQREENIESKRRNILNKLTIKAAEKNPDLYVLAMSATPIINNLTEPKMLIEFLTGKEHPELNTKISIACGVQMHRALTIHGLRYIPDYNISENEIVHEVVANHLLSEVKNIRVNNQLDNEKLVLNTKLEEIKKQGWIKKGTLIYTHYVTDIIKPIGEFVKQMGFKIGYYTGDDKSGLTLFKAGKIDVLIGSEPIGTGVDGIQAVCDTLIPIIMPWTSSEYQQLKGRVNRQGTNFKKVNIYIPLVVFEEDGNRISLDKRRWNRIKHKRTVADMVLDGKLPNELLPSIATLIEYSRKELIEMAERVENGQIHLSERDVISSELNPELVDNLPQVLSEFSKYNKTWGISNSETTHKTLKDNPSDWVKYHSYYAKARSKWPEIPFEVIGEKLKKRPDWVIGDFGCGENLLAKSLPNKFYSFDHIAIDENVISCDIKNVPIGNDLLDAVVFSLSLQGSNYIEYLKEAYRVLRPYGKIFISETAKRWKNREDVLIDDLKNCGFKSLEITRNTEKFIYITGFKE